MNFFSDINKSYHMITKFFLSTSQKVGDIGDKQSFFGEDIGRFSPGPFMCNLRNHPADLSMMEKMISEPLIEINLFPMILAEI
ncbi:MAG: hypothetical protein MUO63_03925 [Desulfobulbaceae bacterium]|nr:hypothetical protein [Desulfobulbaceae bacterium]